MHKQIQVTLETGHGPRPRVKVIIWKNHRIKLYSIGWLRYMTFLADVTIRGWERKGILPKPFFKLSGGVRWYTPAELMAYSTYIHQHYQSGRDLNLLESQLGKAHVAIRNKYLGLKTGSAIPVFMQQLSAEKQIQEAFDNYENKRTLSREHFAEVQALVQGKESGENLSLPSPQAKSCLPVNRGIIRNRDTDEE